MLAASAAWWWSHDYCWNHANFCKVKNNYLPNFFLKWQMMLITEWLTAGYRNFISVLFTCSSDGGVAALQYHQIVTSRTANSTHEKTVATGNSIPVWHRLSHNWTHQHITKVSLCVDYCTYLNTHESRDDLEWLNAPEYPNWWQITSASVEANCTSSQMYPQLDMYTCTRPDE